MPDFRKMYFALFRSQTIAIGILQEAQKSTEEMYIEVEPPDIKLLNLQKDEDSQETPGEDDKKD